MLSRHVDYVAEYLLSRDALQYVFKCSGSEIKCVMYLSVYHETTTLCKSDTYLLLAALTFEEVT